jgi:hypothetical protein
MKLRGRFHQILFVSVIAAFALGAKCECSLGGKKLDRAKLDALIRQLAESQAMPPKSITCPPDVAGKEGDVFECTVEMGDGRATVIVTMQKDFNAFVNWKGTFAGGKRLHTNILELLGEPAKQAGLTGVDCGEQLLDDGETIVCKPIGGPPGRIDARLKGTLIEARFVAEGTDPDAPPPVP